MGYRRMVDESVCDHFGKGPDAYNIQRKAIANIRCVGWEEEIVFIAVAEKGQTSPDLGKRTKVTCFRSTLVEWRRYRVAKLVVVEFTSSVACCNDLKQAAHCHTYHFLGYQHRCYMLLRTLPLALLRPFSRRFSGDATFCALLVRSGAKVISRSPTTVLVLTFALLLRSALDPNVRSLACKPLFEDDTSI